MMHTLFVKDRRKKKYFIGMNEWVSEWVAAVAKKASQVHSIYFLIL